VKPRLTDKVKLGLWLIVSRSATLLSAEQTDAGWDRAEREAVLAAGRYAEAHWAEKQRQPAQNAADES
jgi:hypothetical protein